MSLQFRGAIWAGDVILEITSLDIFRAMKSDKITKTVSVNGEWKRAKVWVLGHYNLKKEGRRGETRQGGEQEPPVK